MNTDQLALWNRIKAFPIDEPNASFPFSKRLARENRWPHTRALRAIEEYKRFIFLGCVAGHPVSPSEDVDQVWHLHLAYTRSYWKDFCADTLGQPFHHNPTKGGSDESAKFEDWYARTLASYEKFFGAKPPAEFWPARPIHNDLTWVDRASHWIIPKPRWAAVAAILSAIVVTFAIGCVQAELGEININIFDMKGTDFLLFFPIFATIIFTGAAVWRRSQIKNLRVPDAKTEGLDAYDIAFLSGRGPLAVDAAVIGLVDRKLLNLDDSGNLSVLYPLGADAELHPLEKSIMQECSREKRKLGDVRRLAKPILETIRTQLEDRALVHKFADVRKIRRNALLLALIVPAIGLIKIIVGASRGKPVEFLVVLTIIAAIIAFIAFLRLPFRTPAGDQLLEELRLENDNLKTPQPAFEFAGPSVLPLAIALFGMPILAATPYEPLQKVFKPQNTGSDGGCSSSGCSSGSSGCGGGGCGGGGCGGCGGGD